ncbi:MAG TPA: ArsR family transcriptional regulator, partial [Bacteroidia bacterium]
IAKRETCICGEVVEVLPLAQSTVSQHLKELLKAGLITGTVEGVKSCYCINYKTFEKFEKIFNEFFIKTNSNNSKCC